MGLTTHRNAVIAFAAIASLTMAARTAEAQLPKLSEFHPSLYGSTELDTRSSQFYLLGVYVGIGGLGWSPYFNLNGYSLHYRLDSNVASSARTLSAILPTVGLAYAARSNGVSFGAGYAWVDNEDPGAPGAEGG